MLGPDPSAPATAAVRRVRDGVAAFAADMRSLGLHVGVSTGTDRTECVTCRVPYPCAAAGR